jgi:drug/metabolite transporter (DMT)-like permease
MQLRVWAAIIVAALGWGTSGVATRAALDAGVLPYSLVAWRTVISVAVTVAILLISQRHLARQASTWTTGSVLAVTNLAVPFVLFTLAYEYAGAGFVGLIVALIPLVTAVIANFALPDEKLKPVKVFGLSLGFTGIAILLATGDTGIGDAGDPFIAGLLSLVAVGSISFAGVYAKGRSGTYDPVQLSGVQFIVGAILLVTAAIVVEGLQTDMSGWGWTLIFYMAVIGTVVPFTLFYWILGHTSATKASLIGYVVPLIAIVAGITLLDEQLEFGIAVGGVLILAGVIITDRGERRDSTTERTEPTSVDPAT